MTPFDLAMLEAPKLEAVETVDRKRRWHRRPTRTTAHSTAYCLRGTMADGSYTRHGSVAMNTLPLGSHITILGRAGPGGRRNFVVRDRIGHSSELDFWTPTCAHAMAWGRRVVRWRRGRG